MNSLGPRRWSAFRVVRFLTVVLALAVQVASGGGAGRMQAGPTALDAATVFCQAGHGKGDRDLPPLHHRLNEAAILQVGAAYHPDAMDVDAGACLPVRAPDERVRVRVPEARAPPVWRVANFEPTGPPGPV